MIHNWSFHGFPKVPCKVPPTSLSGKKQSRRAGCERFCHVLSSVTASPRKVLAFDPARTRTEARSPSVIKPIAPPSLLRGRFSCSVPVEKQIDSPSTGPDPKLENRSSTLTEAFLAWLCLSNSYEMYILLVEPLFSIILVVFIGSNEPNKVTERERLLLDLNPSDGQNV